MSVRAKFRCMGKDEVGNINLYAVTGDTPENKAFFNATPNGQVRLGVVNSQAAEQFEVGKDYYVDFMPAD